MEKPIHNLTDLELSPEVMKNNTYDLFRVVKFNIFTRPNLSSEILQEVSNNKKIINSNFIIEFYLFSNTLKEIINELYEDQSKGIKYGKHNVSKTKIALTAQKVIKDHIDKEFVKLYYTKTVLN